MNIHFKHLTALLMGPLIVLWANASAAAPTNVSYSSPGSTLMWPFRLNSKTVIRLTNNGAEDVSVRLVRVCGADKSFNGQGFCTGTNKEVELTPQQTRVFDVESFFSVNPASCPDGFVIAFPVDADGTPIRTNQLTGSVYLRDTGPGKLQAAAAPAISFKSFAEMEGDPIGSGGAFPTLDFDGTSLERVPNTYSADFRASDGAGVTKKGSLLHLISLNTQAGAQNDPTLVALDWTNQQGERFSGSLEYVCYTRIALDEIPGAGGSFTAGNLGSKFGQLKISVPDSGAVVGYVEEFENNRLTLTPLSHFGEAADTPFEFIGR